MENYQECIQELQKELESLPRDYPLHMARGNRDIVDEQLTTFNIGRLLIFLDNVKKGIPDKVRITSFGIDGPPTTKILYYDSNIILYLIDGSRYSTNHFYVYCGNEITIRKRRMKEDIILDVNLIPLCKEEVTILHIWAGYKEADRF